MDARQVISEPRRREILRLVWTDERSAGDIASRFDVTFGTVSQHLGILRDAGFVQTRRDGNRRPYRADWARLGPLALAWQSDAPAGRIHGRRSTSCPMATARSCG